MPSSSPSSLVSLLIASILMVMLVNIYFATQHLSPSISPSSAVPSPPAVANVAAAAALDLVQRRDGARMSAVITTFKQPICLQRMLQHLQTCDIVGEIRVNWFEDTVPPPNTARNANNAYGAPVIYDVLPNGISYRFSPRDFAHDAVFTVDVDTYYSCRALTLAYSTWAATPEPANAAVGFHPRLLMRNGPSPGYDWRTSFFPPFRRNTLFVTKGGVTHKGVFETYFNPKFAELRDMVDEAITAEDMLMSFVLAAEHQVNQITICLEVQDHCDVECAQNKVESLHHRTSNSRQSLLEEFYRFFEGPPIRDTYFEVQDDHLSDHPSLLVEEQDAVMWIAPDGDKSQCRSNNNLIGSGGGDDKGRRKCLFCETNEVCPSDVK